MYFNSFEDFIAMGGHGVYVWACYFVVIVGLLGYFFHSKKLVQRKEMELIKFYQRMDARKAKKK